MILVGRYLSPFTRRVAVTLNFAGLKFENRAIPAAEQDKVRAFNPVGRVPALVLDGGETLIDSAAIVDYLAQTYGAEKCLMPEKGDARTRCLRLIALVTGGVEKFVAAHYERSFRPPEKVHQPWLDRLLAQAEGAFAAVEREGGTPWLAGPQMTQADLWAAVAMTFMRTLRPENAPPTGKFPKLDRLTERCEAMPEFRSTKPPPPA